MQKVYLSRTVSGRVGLFTHGTLVLPLDLDQIEQFKKDPIAFCSRYAFTFVSSDMSKDVCGK